jgi:hypothetical protein
MGESEVRPRPEFDLVASKLLQPLARPGTVPRPGLVERLAADPRTVGRLSGRAGHAVSDSTPKAAVA